MRSLMTTCLIVSSVICYAQDLQPGFIVNERGDTIRGTLDAHAGNSPYVSCHFKDYNGTAETYTPREILAYGVTGKGSYRTTDIVVQDIRKKVFCEVLLDGTIDLLKHKQVYFLVKNDSPAVIPLRRQAVPGSNDPSKRFSYSQQLQIHTIDCPSIVNGLKVTRFNEQNLITYLEKYHKCKNLPFRVYKNDLPWATVGLRPFVGYNVASLTVSNLYENKDLRPAAAHSPIIGASFRFRFPRTNQHLSAFTDVMYSSHMFKSTTTIIGLGDAYTYEFLKLRMHTIKIPLGVSYVFSSKSDFAIQGGLAFNYYSGTSTFTTEGHYNGQVFVSHRNEDSSGMKNGIFVGAEYTVNAGRFEIPVALRIDRTPSFTLRKSQLTSVYLICSIRKTTK